jgi:hypothetical protein
MRSEMYGAADQMEFGGHQLIAALEGRMVEGDPKPWTARIHGLYGDERSWWIQVARADDDTASVVLRCSRFATAEHATAVLRRWQPTPALSLLVMNVMLAA